MRVLVACEFSGAVRDAFRRRGHEAWSCDLLPSDPSEFDLFHFEGDVLDVMTTYGWDLMIAHLWLKNLPPLVPTNVLAKPARGYWDNQTPSGQNKLGPSPTRAHERSRTYAGIAEAMAEQWGAA